ncbi:MAG: (2Fe-2S)-binding protein [Thaumarchaeota archaeon]|nr:(2Fe-2S)-binding protein [Nitrososphaerota archaeon]
MKVGFTVNGNRHELDVEPRMTLLDTLRDNLDLTGSKKGCDEGVCGACTVILDGKAVCSCMTFAVEAEGSDVLTIEGIADGAELDPIQKAFIEFDGMQCGFCTSGQIMSAKAFLMSNAKPTKEEIREAMSGNICRCGAYINIVDAIFHVSKEAK